MSTKRPHTLNKAESCSISDFSLYSSYKKVKEFISDMIKILRKRKNPVGIYLLKVNNRNTRTRCYICSNLTLRVPLTYIFALGAHCAQPLYMHPNQWRIYTPGRHFISSRRNYLEQPRTYMYAQNRQLQQPRKKMPATKGVYEKVTRR